MSAAPPIYYKIKSIDETLYQHIIVMFADVDHSHSERNTIVDTISLETMLDADGDGFDDALGLYRWGHRNDLYQDEILRSMLLRLDRRK